jgi:hypothetical protein
MRVKTLTLTTASAAALTIGLASPALALAPTAGMGAVHNQTGFGAQHQGALHDGLHHLVVLPKGDDDDDDDGDDGGGGDAEVGGVHRARHFGGPRGLCGIGGHIGGFAHGCGEDDGDDDDEDGGGGGGDFGSQHVSAGGGGGGVRHVRVSRPAAAPRHYMVPRGAIRTGFGGSQGLNAPLGLAGLTLLVGGAGLVPLARRRLRASARS